VPPGDASKNRSATDETSRSDQASEGREHRFSIGRRRRGADPCDAPPRNAPHPGPPPGGDLGPGGLDDLTRATGAPGSTPGAMASAGTTAGDRPAGRPGEQVSRLRTGLRPLWGRSESFLSPAARHDYHRGRAGPRPTELDFRASNHRPRGPRRTRGLAGLRVRPRSAGHAERLAVRVAGFEQRPNRRPDTHWIARAIGRPER